MFMLRRRYIVFFAVVLGALLGTGIALAGDIQWQMESGYQAYGPSRMSCSACGTPWAFPYHYYDEDYTGTADDYYPDATEFLLGDGHYANGYSDDPTNNWFAGTRLYDSTGSDAFWDFTFSNYDVDGINRTAQYDHTWDGLSSSDQSVFSTQWVWSGEDAMQHNTVFWAQD